LKYATTATTNVIARRAAAARDIPLQRLMVRSDMRPGSTVGPVSWARTGIPTIDIGVGLIAMHAIRETASLSDIMSTSTLVLAMIEECGP
jgi:aspartyl aminopeptidase